MNKKKILLHIVVLFIVSYFFLMFGNGFLSLTNPDEVFYTQTAKEMMQRKSWFVPYLFGEPNFEKPILTYYFLRAGYELFGISNSSSRLFPALFGIFGVIAAYLLALVGYRDEKKALICALVLVSSGLYVGLSRTVFTDMIFSILILFSMVSFYYGYQKQSAKGIGIILSFAFSGLAVLAKGPLGFLIPGAAIALFLCLKKDLKFLRCRYAALGFFICSGLCVPWYWFMTKKFNAAFIQEFFYNDHVRRLFEAEHSANDTWYFYPWAMLSCMFPWSVFVLAALTGFFRRFKEKAADSLNLFLICWIVAVFFAFQFAHSKLVSYIFPMFPALAIISGDYIITKLYSGARSFLLLLRVFWAILFILPGALVFASFKYSQYVPSRVPIYIFVAVYLCILFFMLLAIRKRKPHIYLYLLTPLIPLLVICALGMHAQYEAHVSSQQACRYLLDNYSVTTRILCSKSVVRGVRFFTDKEVAVINVRGGDFFSPHPVPYLDSDEKVLEFLGDQPATYGVLTKSSLSDLERVTGKNKYNLNVLKKIGNTFIVLIQVR